MAGKQLSVRALQNELASALDDLNAGRRDVAHVRAVAYVAGKYLKAYQTLMEHRRLTGSREAVAGLDGET